MTCHLNCLLKINSFSLLIVANLALLLSGCGGGGSSSSSTSSDSPADYCSPVTSIESAVEISGHAQYQYRIDGNGAISSATPIRYAEVVVRNSAGDIVQCGETDSNGDFNLQVPSASSSHTVSIQSRANNRYVKAYVLSDPTSNSDHRVSKTVTPDSDQDLGNFTASAKGTLEGGAFNILDRILDANLYLRTQTANCASIHSSCSPITVAPLVIVYWAPGQDPGTFFTNVSGASFYVPGTSKLYLLGGRNGDVDRSDCDHFDNTIILHEYAHFLEDTFAASDSPGGSHSGNTILDARLAWGEAWANFFQAQVTGISVYRDTFGTIDGTPGVYFNQDLEFGTKDQTSTAGEANFREFSITRALVDIFDSDNAATYGDGRDSHDTLTAPFAEFWTLFTSTQVGFMRSSSHFRDIGLLYSLQASLSGGTDWSAIQSFENQVASRTHYANTLSSGGSCTNTIQAANIPGSNPAEDGTPENSNQFASNRFYRYDHSGGALKLDLTYTTNSLNPADLDLYLYQEDYIFGSLSDVIDYSETTHNTGQSSGSETISVSSLAAGTYMINVHVYTGTRLGSQATYTLKINNTTVCPD